MSSTQQLLLGEGAGGGIPNYIEEVFSTWLYTGNDTSQTITNNIDLSTKGGLVWIKSRSGTYSTGYHVLNDTVRGAQRDLYTNTSGAQSTNAQGLTAFTSTGFSVGNSTDTNGGTTNMVSWTFRKQPKFFDVVTYTGTGGSQQTIAHNLGSVPGCIIVKRTSASANWAVYHRSLPDSQYSLLLNLTGAQDVTDYFTTTAPTSTNFTVSATSAVVNGSGSTYVAYLFAHDAGGFGLTGSDNVISCGGYTGNDTSQSITLGYEPQWILAKPSSAAGDWFLFDNMRGIATGGSEATLKANDSAAESNAVNALSLNATGFDLPSASFNNSGVTYIYIAIRRGPMKVPTLGTNVYNAVTRSGTSAAATISTAGFTPDMVIAKSETGSGFPGGLADRLRGTVQTLFTPYNSAESTESQGVTAFTMNGMTVGTDNNNQFVNVSGSTFVNWFFKRAPSFFDEVCYTGTGSNTTVTHNLAAVPELMIVKKRSGNAGWLVYAAGMGNTKAMRLNSTQAEEVESTFWNNTTPTSTVFSLGNNGDVNGNTATFVWYGFATCAGVSKVGSYTGTGALQTVACGFTTGARFVLIKRTDSTGNWFVWDSARGISSSDDPYILLNSATVQVTGTNYVDTDTTGFKVTAAAPAAINASAGTFIFLAIA